MKKPFVLLGVFVALLVFALIYQKSLDRRLNTSSLSKAEGREFLLPNIPADKVRKIIVRDATGKVTLTVAGDRWTVEERSGYPASLEKIRRAVETLESAKIKDRKEVGKSALAKMKVLAPEEQAGAGAGLQVQLLDEKGDVVAGVVLGESPKSSGGANSGNFMGGPAPQRFARTPNDKDTVWLVEDSFSDIQTDAKSWLDTSWPTIADVKSVELTHANAADSWKAGRKSAEDAFTFVGAPAGEELDTAKASGLAGRVLEGPLNDVVPKDKVTADFMKGATQVKVTTFAGFIYDIEIKEKKAEGESGFSTYLVRFKVAGDFPKQRTAGADEKEEDKKKLDAEFEENSKKLAEQLTNEQAMQGWVFELSQYAVNSLIKKKSEVLREKEPATPTTPSTPGGVGLPPTLAPPTIAPAPPPTPGVPPAMLQKPTEPATPAAPTAPAKPDAGKPAEPAPAAPKPADAPPAPAKPAETPAATTPAQMPPAAPAKPAEPTPGKPVEPTPAKPAPAKPAEPKPAEPAPAKPAEPAPAKPAEPAPAKPAEPAPAKPAEPAPAKPAEPAPAAPAADTPPAAPAPKPAEEKPAQ